MAMLRHVFGGCVSDRSARAEAAARQHKIKFDVRIDVALKNGHLPLPLVEILVIIAQEGMGTVDLFRRPGNPTDIRRIVKRLAEAKPVIYTNYSYYTLASVIKKFLIRIPGGIFTPEGEAQLLQVLCLRHKMDQIKAVHDFLTSLSKAHQQLLVLLFGVWFRMVNHQHVNFMTVEALSRSVAGSMFHTCAEDPAKVEKASRMMTFLMENFGVQSMFGEDNIRFFAETTRTGLHVRELFRYKYQYPSEEMLPPVSPDVIEMTRMEEGEERGREVCDSPEPGSPQSPLSPNPGASQPESQLTITVTTASAPEVSLMPSPEVSKRPKSLEDNLNEVKTTEYNRSLSRFNSVKRKQLERLRQRSDWFLGPGHSSTQSEDCPSTFKKDSGSNLGPKSSSEGAVLDVFSDGDSVFTNNTSRSESPASEPVRSLMLKGSGRQNVIHSDTLVELGLGEMEPRPDTPDEVMSEDEDEEMMESEMRCFLVEHQYGDITPDS